MDLNIFLLDRRMNCCGKSKRSKREEPLEYGKILIIIIGNSCKLYNKPANMSVIEALLVRASSLVYFPLRGIARTFRPKEILAV